MLAHTVYFGLNDAYQDSPQHGRFLEEHQANWRAIRVFDAYVES